MSICRAGTLLIPSGPYHDPDRLHLHVICNDVDSQGYVLVVGIATWINANICDATCRLQAHEHPWLSHESYVFYRNAELRPAAALDAGVKSGLLRTKESMNGQTFLRVRNGICTSMHTSKKIKRYFGCAPVTDGVVK